MVWYLSKPHDAWSSESITHGTTRKIFNRDIDTLGPSIMVAFERLISSTQCSTERIRTIFYAVFTLGAFYVKNLPVHFDNGIREKQILRGEFGIGLGFEVNPF
jgi:hypothetical protein